MKILVVDDEANIRLLVRHNLERLGHEVLLACSAEEGVALARREVPDLIFQDMMLPGESGMDALAAYRADDDTASIPVVMCTARSQRADIDAAMAAGATGYLVKPFDPEALRQWIDRIDTD